MAKFDGIGVYLGQCAVWEDGGENEEAGGI